MSGEITIVDKDGGIVMCCNVWTLLLVSVFTGKFSIDPERVRVFVDGKEIEEPEIFQDDN